MKEKELRIIKKLPQIILPNDKVNIFLKWYDEDLRFQDEVPKSFERGYIILNNIDKCENFELFKYKSTNIFKELAQKYNTTYRQIENYYNEFIEEIKNTIIYFEFDNDLLKLEIYLKNKLFATVEQDLKMIDSSKPNPSIIEAVKRLLETGEDFRGIYDYYCLTLVKCCLWYIATTTKTTKYYRQDKTPKFFYEKKEIINVKRNKTISTPIYDISKIKRVKVDSLIKRRKGWTYSHAFQVHGHYRHYSSGKTIFIEPFIKGRGKKEMSQIITLNPKEIK